MRSSASKEKTRRCRDHFLLFLLGRFSETAPPAALRLLLLIKKKMRPKMAMAATTTGTATAALRPGEQEMPLHELSSTSTAPLVVLLAALPAVPLAPSLVLGLTSEGAGDVMVDKVVGTEPAPEEADVPDELPDVVVAEAEAAPNLLFVILNSLWKEARAPLRAEVEGPSAAVTPVKPSSEGPGAMVLGGLNELVKVKGGEESGIAERAIRLIRGRRRGRSRGSRVLETPRQGQRSTCKKGKDRGEGEAGQQDECVSVL